MHWRIFLLGRSWLSCNVLYNDALCCTFVKWYDTKPSKSLSSDAMQSISRGEHVTLSLVWSHCIYIHVYTFYQVYCNITHRNVSISLQHTMLSLLCDSWDAPSTSGSTSVQVTHILWELGPEFCALYCCLHKLTTIADHCSSGHCFRHVVARHCREIGTQQKWQRSLLFQD